ncbi:MAG: hypothetical protein H6R26_2695, partial [Proteobacteria bacterium]|nr:hypothetical protein [Pseudomonadota bacterium]
LQGIMDLAGNVWEWCQNKYCEPDGVEVDASGDPRALRGGSWGDASLCCRADYRGLDHLLDRGGYCGFRVVRAHLRPHFRRR